MGKLEEFVLDHDPSNCCFIVRTGEVDSDIEIILASVVKFFTTEYFRK